MAIRHNPLKRMQTMRKPDFSLNIKTAMMQIANPVAAKMRGMLKIDCKQIPAEKRIVYLTAGVSRPPISSPAMFIAD